MSEIVFGPAPPKGRSLSLLFLASAGFFLWIAYLLHCDGFACDTGRPGSRALPLLAVMVLVSLVCAYLVRNWQGVWAHFRISEDGFAIAARGGLFEPEQTIEISRIATIRHVPQYLSKGTIVFDLVPEKEGASRGKYVNLPLDGLSGPASPVFEAIERAMESAGYGIEGRPFRPAMALTAKRWSVRRG